jgi:hypothetical protein
LLVLPLVRSESFLPVLGARYTDPSPSLRFFQRAGAIAWAVLVAVSSSYSLSDIHFSVSGRIADPSVLELCIFRFTVSGAESSCSYAVNIFSLSILNGEYSSRCPILQRPLYKLMFMSSSRQIYGGIGLGVGAAAVITMFALSNVRDFLVNFHYWYSNADR